MSKYSKEAVDREIAKDKRIDKREAKLIHALLKGPDRNATLRAMGEACAKEYKARYWN